MLATKTHPDKRKEKEKFMWALLGGEGLVQNLKADLKNDYMK